MKKMMKGKAKTIKNNTKKPMKCPTCGAMIKPGATHTDKPGEY